jgi:ABC-type sugar transport system substrate-binding protein
VSERRVALFLVDETNEFQLLLRADAVEAADVAGFTLETHFSGIDFANQISLVQRTLEVEPRPHAILVMCVNDRGLQRVARRAAQSGVHVVFLNGSEDDLAAVRAESPKVAVSIVCPDERETGRIQARQLRQLVRPHGRVLYVQGRLRSLAARDRTAGLLEGLAGEHIEVVPIEAGWTVEDGHEAVWGYLRMVLRVNRQIDVVCCQNDALARGAIEALDAVATELRRPEIRSIAVTGCDGSPEGGQALVRRGALRATIILPRATAPALELLDQALRTGVLPPPTVLLRPSSFPPETELLSRGQGRPTIGSTAQASATA